MAKKKAAEAQVNKSQAIRDYLQANPKATPKETATAMAEQGIDVSPGYVSTIKMQAKKKRKGRRGRKAAAEAGPAGDKIALSSLIRAKKLAEQLGGLEKAQAALAALEKLQ